MKKISVIIAKQHSTSITLEDEFYKALCQIAKEQKINVNQLITMVDSTRTTPNLSSALRVYVLKTLQEKLSLIKTN